MNLYAFCFVNFGDLKGIVLCQRSIYVESLSSLSFNRAKLPEVDFFVKMYFV